MSSAPPDFATLHRQVVFGESDGKIIWQPRIISWYENRRCAGEDLPPPYQGLSLPDLYRTLGVSARLYEFNACFKRIEHPGVRFLRKALNDTDTQLTIQTPVGNQITVSRRSPGSSYERILKWEVESPEELKVAIWREENCDWEWDQAMFTRLQAELGDLGAPTMFMPRMNIQSLYIEKMGVEKAVYALYDWPDLVETYFRAVDDNHARLIHLIKQSPIDIINLGENIHAGTLSPELFRKYHLPACQWRCEQLHKAGKFVSAHWDGDVKPLLPFAKETGLDGIEAITPKPQGDVELEEVKDALGDDMILLDGIPAVFFESYFTEDELLRFAEKVIKLFAPKLVLGISDEIPATGEIERIKLIRDLVNEYNQMQEQKSAG